MNRAYTATSKAMSGLVALIGVAMVVLTVARGGGILSLGVILGTAFACLGAARLYLARSAPADTRT